MPDNPAYKRLKSVMQANPYSAAAAALNNGAEQKKAPSGLGPSAGSHDKQMYELRAARANENYKRMSSASYASKAYPPKKKKKNGDEEY